MGRTRHIIFGEALGRRKETGDKVKILCMGSARDDHAADGQFFNQPDIRCQLSYHFFRRNFHEIVQLAFPDIYRLNHSTRIRAAMARVRLSPTYTGSTPKAFISRSGAGVRSGGMDGNANRTQPSTSSDRRTPLFVRKAIGFSFSACPFSRRKNELAGVPCPQIGISAAGVNQRSRNSC